MKIIETLDEYYLAGTSNRLEYFDDKPEWITPINWEEDNICDVYTDIQTGLYRWKPEEMTFVEMEFFQRRQETPSNTFGWFVKGKEPDEDWKPTGRTVTGVVSDG